MKRLDEDLSRAKTAKAFGATNLSLAESIAKSISTDLGLRDETLFRVVERVDANDPDRAEGIAKSIYAEEMRTEAMEGIAYERERR